MARVVREDPVRRGLLYAGTDAGVYVSYDDGDHWHSLQLNLPTATVTDLAVHDNDLVASTFGRSLWILDDLSPLRQIDGATGLPDSTLLLPETAMRVRWDNYQDTPLPPETPAGQNPPDGAIMNYYLKSPPAGELSMTIYDANGGVVRRFSNQAQAPNLPLPNVPAYWFGPVEGLSTRQGLNRFVWDLRYPAPRALPYAYFGGLLEYTEYTLADHAIPENTPRQQPQGDSGRARHLYSGTEAGWSGISPATDGSFGSARQSSQSDLEEQLTLEQRIMRGMEISFDQYQEVAALHKALAARQTALGLGSPSQKIKDEAAALEKKIDRLEKGPRTAPGFGTVNRDLTRLLTGVESADIRPSETSRAAAGEKCKALDEDLALWKRLE